MNEWDWLVDTIPIGQRDAVSMTYLAKLHRMTKRELRREVEQARRAGILICSSNRGYFMPESMQDISEHAHRAGERIRTATACLAPFLRVIRKGW